MRGNESFELDTELSDGRHLSVVGTVDVVYNCDCGDELHAHIEDIYVESIIQPYAVGIDDTPLKRNTRAWQELEEAIEDYVYNQLKAS